MKFRECATLVLKLFLILLGLELFLYALTSVQFQILGIRPYFNIDRIDHFIDLQVVTLNGFGCDIPIRSIYQESCYFNPTNIPRLFIYFARTLYIGPHNTNLIGLVVGLISIISLYSLYRFSISSFHASLAAVVIVGGYPYRLALERGNIDIIVLCLIFGSCLLLSFANQKSREFNNILIIFSISLLTIATLGKVYPILTLFIFPLACLLLNQFSLKEIKYVTTLVLLLLIVSSSILVPDIFHMTNSSYKEFSGGLGYGLLTSPDPKLPKAIVLLIKCSVIGIISSISSCNRSDFFGSQYSSMQLASFFKSHSPKYRLISIMFLFGSVIFIGTYFVFINGIYRLVVSISLMGLWFAFWASVRIKSLTSDWSGGGCFVIFAVFAMLIVGYRPYISESNLQHLTQQFVEYVFYPVVCAYLFSTLILILSHLAQSHTSKYAPKSERENNYFVVNTHLR